MICKTIRTFGEKVHKLKQAATINKELNFKQFQEFEIVNDVVFMNGYMIPPELQKLFYGWIISNESLFMDNTKKW